MTHFGSFKDDQERYEERRVDQRHTLEQEIKNFHYRAVHSVIFAVGTGTFVLSISFIGNIHTALRLPGLLIGAWVVLAITIIAKVASNWLGINAAGARQILLEDFKSSGYMIPMNFNVNNPSNNYVDRLNKYRNFFDIVSIFFLCLAISLLILFASANILFQTNSSTSRDTTIQSATSTKL